MWHQLAGIYAHFLAAAEPSALWMGVGLFSLLLFSCGSAAAYNLGFCLILLLVVVPTFGLYFVYLTSKLLFFFCRLLPRPLGSSTVNLKHFTFTATPPCRCGNT